jgi:hypothetical protein
MTRFIEQVSDESSGLFIHMRSWCLLFMVKGYTGAVL